MQVNRTFPGILLIVTLLALPFVVGSSCIVIFGSGGGSSHNDRDNNDDTDDDDDDDEEFIIVKSGSFSAPATQGLNYESGALSGVTGEDGEFQYQADQPVQFSIGDVKLGPAVEGKPVITPQDLAAESADAGTVAVNLSRLLQSLDADRSDDAVSIPAVARDAAVRSNASVSAAIASLDFSDESRFVNAASQLVATLTAPYPFTATLVDAEQVRQIDTENTAGAQ